MCQFISFAISEDGTQLLRGPRLNSYQGIEKKNKVRAHSYREAEWVAEGKEGLSVRTLCIDSDRHDERAYKYWYKAAILGMAKTRDILLEKLMTPVEKKRRKIAQIIATGIDRTITSALTQFIATGVYKYMYIHYGRGSKLPKVGPINKRLKKFGFAVKVRRRSGPMDLPYHELRMYKKAI